MNDDAFHVQWLISSCPEQGPLDVEQARRYHVCLSISLCICLSVYLPVCLCVYLSVYPFQSICMFVYLLVYLYVCLYVSNCLLLYQTLFISFPVLCLVCPFQVLCMRRLIVKWLMYWIVKGEIGVHIQIRAEISFEISIPTVALANLSIMSTLTVHCVGGKMSRRRRVMATGTHMPRLKKLSCNTL